MASRAVGLGNKGGRLEGRCDPRIEGDGRVVVLREPIISFLAALLDPFSEGLADSGVDHVADVGPGHLADLPEHGERVHDVRIAQPEVEDVVQRQNIVLWDREDVDVVAVDGLKAKED